MHSVLIHMLDIWTSLKPVNKSEIKRLLVVLSADEEFNQLLIIVRKRLKNQAP